MANQLHIELRLRSQGKPWDHYIVGPILSECGHHLFVCMELLPILIIRSNSLDKYTKATITFIPLTSSVNIQTTNLVGDTHNCSGERARKEGGRRNEEQESSENRDIYDIPDRIESNVTSDKSE